MAAGDPGSPARYYSSTAVETSLQSSIAAQSQGASNTSFIVASISGFPTSYPYTLIVDPDTSKEEVLTVTSGSSTTLTVTRGADNTQAVAHSAGAVVRHGVSARDFRESENHIAARGYDIDQGILDAANQTHVHGIATGDGVIVGTDKEQTLNNKTIGANGLKFEGTTTNAFDTTLNVEDPTANRTITFPNTSGTVTINDAAQTLSNKTLGSNLAAGTFKITGLGDPTVAQDAATKNYVDTGVSSGVAQAAASAAAAATSATSASNSATAAATSASSAAASATASASSASASATSATAAATSATSAAASATAAATSATSAANSATAAATSATSAATSATSAAASATTAAASVAAIAGYAAAAATSEANALTSANSAATSAASAAASTSAAAASASAAATSATSAANSATAAATSATSAAASALAAATSATSATASATLANDWATLMTGPVAGGEYSAKYNAGLAATSATSAATSATSAANSATAAATSAASAATSASSAATSYDQFDDRYLGDKSSDPTVDNDGNPLLTGALYYNTVISAMKVYSGSAWQLVAPDTSNFVDKSVLTSKGSLLGASAASTPYAVTPASTNGYILAIDSATTSGLAWIAPNPGDITGVTAGTGLSGGGTSGDVTLNLADTAVTPASYTYTSLTVDAQGRITSASNGTAPVTSVTSGNTTRISIGGTSTAPTVDLSTTAVTAGTYSPANITVDAYGRITSASTGSSLPSQTGNSGKYLTTDGTTASWGTISVPKTYAFKVPTGSANTTNFTVTSIPSGSVVSAAVGSNNCTIAISGTGWGFGNYGNPQVINSTTTTVSFTVPVSWSSPNTTYSSTPVYSIAYGNGTYVIGFDGGVYAYSTDSISWSTSTPSGWGLSNALEDILWNGSYFNAVGGGGRFAYSTNGTTWTTNQYGSTQQFKKGVVVGGSFYFASWYWDGASYYQPEIWYGSGTSLSTQYISSWGTPGRPQAVTYGNGTFVVCGFPSRVVSGSSISSLTSRTTPMSSSYNVDAAAFGNGIFLVASSQMGITSTDGITWTQRTITYTGQTPREAAWDGTRFLVIFSDNNNPIYTSTDGISWGDATNGSLYNAFSGSYSPTSIAYANSRYLVGAGSGQLRTTSIITGTTTADAYATVTVYGTPTTP